MRIAIACVVIADLLIRLSDLTAHYSEQGIWPSHLIKNFGWKPCFWTIHSLIETNWYVASVFAIHILFTICLLVGYKTRISNLIVWLLYISLHNRNLFVLQSGDDLLRLILFWGLFLPWHHCYSIDSKKTNYKLKQVTIPNIAYFILIASVYFFTVNLKNSAEWQSDGTAIYFALSLDQLRLPYAGDWLFYQFALTKILTHVVYYIELFIPFLILFPQKKGYLRLFAFVLILILHIGIGLTMYVGLFYIISITSAFALLPKKYSFRILKFIKIDFLFSQFKSTTKKIYKVRFPSLNYLNNYVLSAIIIVSIILNLSGINWFNYQLKAAIYYPINMFRLDQYWGMFSPTVMKRDGWFVLDGRDSIGAQWDIVNNDDYVEFTKPKHVVRNYTTDRWRKLAENMQGNNTFLRPLFCKYLLTKWNKEHPEKKLAILNLYFMSKNNLLNYKTTPVEKESFCVCSE